MSKNAKFSPRTAEGPRVGKQLSSGRPAAAAIDSKKKKPAPTGTVAGTKRGAPATNSTDFVFYHNPVLALVCVPRETEVMFSLEDAAHLTGIHPDMLRYYWRTGLIEVRDGTSEARLFFDQGALHEIRRIEYYRTHLGVGRRALPLICQLQRECASQQIELQFLRYP